MKQKILFTAVLVLAAFSFAAAQNYYLGVGDENSPQISACAGCHKTDGIASPIYEQWKNTLHAEAQDSIFNSHYGFACLSCHNTGWDTENENYGADEYVVLDANGTPNYAITDIAGFNRVKNVQCEACHGPLGNEDKTLASSHWDFTGGTHNLDYSAELCGKCHQGSHHGFYEEWEVSGHAKSANTSFVVNNPACVKCHVAQSFIRFANDPENYEEKLDATGDKIQPLTCVACHNPHSKEFPHQLRFPVSGARVICDECHNAEIEDTVDVNSAPHHTTSECFSGTKQFGYQYPGKTYQNSAHTYATKERCINCHLNNDGTDEFGAAHGHKFVPRIQACLTCHADYTAVVDTSNHDKLFDYRGVQSKTDSLMAALQAELNMASSQDSLTDKFKQANYNLLSAQQEGSHGIHNTRLVQKLLQDAIADFNASSVRNENSEIPSEYALSQNYPNPFNPTTEINFALPKAGNVKIIIYDAIGNEVATLVNEYMPQGKYTVDWNASALSSGVYLYRIEANDFSMVKKMVLLK